MIEQYFTTTRKVNSRKKEHWRPAYHFTPPKAWMNDPNGLIYFKGWYHLFYQHNPHNCNWGSMHWGHAVSKDMLHWKDLPIALYPDRYYDAHKEGGCFSGSAIEKDGKLYLFYTSVTYENGEAKQTQSIAMSEDGIHFQKYDKNPVICCVPKGMSADFRDPKVLKVDEKWYMVLGGSLGGADQINGDGRIFLYQSEDLLHWYFLNTLLESKGKMGTMFECPDLFCLQEKWVLTCSPMNHPAYNKAMYCVGKMDFNSGKFKIEKIGSIDDGFDYYAPQSFEDAFGNRILLGWMNGWDWMPWHTDFGPTDIEGWRGALSLPRKVVLDDDLNLKFSLINEFWTLTETIMVCKDKFLDAKNPFELHLDSQNYLIQLSISTRRVASRYIEIGILENRDKGAFVQLDFQEMQLRFDKRNADCYGNGIMITAMKEQEDNIDIKILVDCSVVEIYVNDGNRCVSCNVYPAKDQKRMRITVPDKEAVLNLVKICKVNPTYRD